MEETGNGANEKRSLLGSAQARAKRFEAELKTADDAMAAQLLAAWKEVIIEEMVKLLRMTNSTLTLSCLDNQIAVGQENAALGHRGRGLK